MDHDSSFNKQLRKEITARAVMNKEIKSLQENIDIILKRYIMQIWK